MFFPERIKSIESRHRVLEIGPGGTPHPRADWFLDRHFADAEIAKGQRGHTPPLKTNKPISYYKGDTFPFEAKEFDYVICSHVFEHVEDVDRFAAEIMRVGKAGYIEFPTIYYDYLYDFPEHITALLFDGGEIRWMPKSETGIPDMSDMTRFFNRTLNAGYEAGIQQWKAFFFQGFEWSERFRTRRVQRRVDVCFDVSSMNVPPPPKRPGFIHNVIARLLMFRRPR